MLILLEVPILGSVALAAWFAGRAAAQRRARGRADVLSIVAHDLRNPLSVISSSSSLLLEEPALPEAQRERMLQMTQRAVGQMTRLTSDLLDATRLQEGRLKLELCDVDARVILHQIEETFAQAAIGKKIELRCVIPDSALVVRGDIGRLHQALGNLVANALKFTPTGGKVTVRAATCETGSTVVFSVADTGSGMSAEDQRRVFDRFFQAGGTDSRGVGLGLTITKGIVVAHGGNIWLKSAPGKGTTFFFSVARASSKELDSPATYSVLAPRVGVFPRLKVSFRPDGPRPELHKCALQSIMSGADSSALRDLQPLRSPRQESV
jgi:signal transduction histidine kinase